MLLGKKIEKAIKGKSKSVDEVARAIGMSDVNLYRLFKKDSCETKYLAKLAEVLQLPMKYFFEENWELDISNSNKNQVGINHGQLKQQIGSLSLNDCKSELEKANMEITYLKRENELLREYKK